MCAPNVFVWCKCVSSMCWCLIVLSSSFVVLNGKDIGFGGAVLSSSMAPDNVKTERKCVWSDSTWSAHFFPHVTLRVCGVGCCVCGTELGSSVACGVWRVAPVL